MNLVYKISIILSAVVNIVFAAIVFVIYDQVNAKTLETVVLSTAEVEVVDLPEPVVVEPVESGFDSAAHEVGRLLAEVEALRSIRDISSDDRLCLAQNIFFEARDQDIVGQVAIAWVTLNRVGSEGYPDSICSVVRQAKLDSNGNPIKNQCQFSWYCDGKSDRIPGDPISQRAWQNAELIAEVALLDWARGITGPVEDSVMYHADYVQPYWTISYEIVTQIGNHMFYR